MCCCQRSSGSEIALFVFGLFSFLVSIPGILYSALFWLISTAFSAGEGWFLGLPFIVVFCLLFTTGLLETFFGSGVCCQPQPSCRKCTLLAALVLRVIIVCVVIFILIFYSNLHLFYGNGPYVAPPPLPPYPPNAAPTPPPPWPAWPPMAPRPPVVEPAYPPFPPRPPSYPVCVPPCESSADYSGVTVLIVWMVIIFIKLLVSIGLDVLVMKRVKAAAAPPVAMGMPIPGGGVEMGAQPKA